MNKCFIGKNPIIRSNPLEVSDRLKGMFRIAAPSGRRIFQPAPREHDTDCKDAHLQGDYPCTFFEYFHSSPSL
jgi:hypothetical protein